MLRMFHHPHQGRNNEVLTMRLITSASCMTEAGVSLHHLNEIETRDTIFGVERDLYDDTLNVQLSYK